MSGALVENVLGIRDLARVLDLSIGTVSRALNDRPDVNPETRARVKEAAIRTGYVPDQSGRALRKGRTGLIAAVIQTGGFGQSTDCGLFKILEGTRRRLVLDDLDLVVIFRGPDDDPMEKLRGIVSRRIADAVIITQTIADDPRLAFLRDAGVEHVTLGRSEGSGEHTWVDFDFESVAVKSVQAFARDGHRSMALVVTSLGMNFEDIMIKAFRAEAAWAGLDPCAIHVLRTENGRISREDCAALSDPGARPTAILAGHEGIAASLYAQLPELGLDIGSDVSLISASPAVDHGSLAPLLSHFKTDLDGAGVMIGEQLAIKLQGGASSRQKIRSTLIPMTFTAGESHKRAPSPLRA
jgi:DNA-binding LacI/PurR family transcriptional regulator